MLQVYTKIYDFLYYLTFMKPYITSQPLLIPSYNNGKISFNSLSMTFFVINYLASLFIAPFLVLMHIYDISCVVYFTFFIPFDLIKRGENK